ncbi:HAD-superfamily hydrolase, subfamily IIB [Clostridium pasteurianum DSM 525 = ATCC 6013]|uniref:Cof-like hydrolase n=1 Tax=Clostridium pasteurianum DSM 525 = ATCC 6013 TaxID=1262449 RepID=A0A0H3J1J8_CLOPA|nr:Cof-type HAD-IIB family hydrolase [Clostridium pasteurianum]AJA47264.1 HAD-superfamily hydrolase, subfamily IIB [Clostridium pasteurianum DSM 525 = ATCC 6013]AJA51252.1 HAD-superfamily hydrolase, subfamily IIB [Clostridium pasteurianum DSM 525 = ATCC 6013]AOZ74607.1 haloacid dehalogenase [Clostridium pasteurianum DSM 525 = ATCC 6013]AOZ78404.1 haloacid dehalogenase [Clostridium pasteurianum]ELP57537.1 cof family hydrolase [Clostridium pasteurianum DSM 525 = ATCC 6013]
MFDVIALDLDGTLLKNDKTVSEETIRTLKKHEKLGRQIVIVTARPPRLEPIKLPVELQREFMIFYNGAEIYHNNKRIYSENISLASAKNIKDLILQDYSECKIGFEINNKLYTNFKNNSIFGTTEFETINLNIFQLKSPAKILIDMSNIHNIDAFRLKIPLDCNLIITDNGKLGQIMAHGVNKLNALRYILNKLSTSIDRVMFFGDDINDIELIKESGIGVAMGNAVAKVKDAANYITSSNEEDGIAVFLNRL